MNNNPEKKKFSFKNLSKAKKLFLVFDAVVIFTLLISGVITLNLRANSDNNQMYIVSFNSVGGSIIEEQVVPKDGKAIKPTDPKKDGYLFEEWQLDGKVYDFNTPVTKDITLIAHWQVDVIPKVVVTFDANGGSIVDPLEVSVGTVISPPLNPTRTGYNFSGWYLNGEYFSFSNPIMENITLVAQWKKLATVQPNPVIPPEVIEVPEVVIEGFYRAYEEGGAPFVGQASFALRLIWEFLLIDEY